VLRGPALEHVPLLASKQKGIWLLLHPILDLAPDQPSPQQATTSLSLEQGLPASDTKGKPGEQDGAKSQRDVEPMGQKSDRPVAESRQEDQPPTPGAAMLAKLR